MRSALAGGRTSAEWVAEYEKGHTNPVNQLCHAFGIPMIAVSIPLFVVSFLVDGFWPVPTALFPIGWGFQMGFSIRRPRLRGQAAGVPQGPALLVRGLALVDRPTAGTDLIRAPFVGPSADCRA